MLQKVVFKEIKINRFYNGILQRIRSALQKVVYKAIILKILIKKLYLLLTPVEFFLQKGFPMVFYNSPCTLN